METSLHAIRIALSPLMLNVMQGSDKYQFLSHWFNPTLNRTPILPFQKQTLYPIGHLGGNNFFWFTSTWPSGTARRWQILRDGFDSRLEPIAFDICNGWLLTRRAQAHFAVSLNYCWIFSSINLKFLPPSKQVHHRRIGKCLVDTLTFENAIRVLLLE